MKRSFKKLFLLLAVVIIAVVCFAFSAGALDATGQCGDNVFYIYNNNTWELIISGTGPMWDYDNGKSPFNVSVIGSVVIGEDITTIGDSAFSDCIALSRVTIGDSVTRIGDGAFSRCNFNSIVIPDSVTTIGESAFFCCYYLKSIIIPESVITIGDLAFYYCTAIKDVYYSGTEEQWDKISIGSSNVKLTGATIHYNYCSHTDTNSDKFCDDCGKYTEKLYKSDKCGENVTYEWYEDGMVIISGTGPMTDYENYNGSPFYYSNIKSVIINDGVTTIGDKAFYDCDSLTEVTIPDSVEYIEEDAFLGCNSLEEITILNPDCIINNLGWFEHSFIIYGYSGSTAEKYADRFSWADFFEYCPHKNTKTIDSIEATCHLNGYSSGSICLDCNRYASGGETIVASHKDINNDDVCDHCNKEMPIKSGQCGGDKIFGDQMGMGGRYNGTAKYYLYDDGTLEIYGKGEIDLNSWGNDCGGKANTPGIFEDNKAIKNVIIYEGLTGIGYRAFCGCDNIISVTIPDSITMIDDRAFCGCTNIKSVYASDEESWLRIEFYGDCQFYEDFWGDAYVGNFSSNPLSYGAKLYFDGKLVTNLVIPDGISTIKSGAFFNYSNLESVTIPNSITTIEESAFKGCESLTNITVDKDNGNYCSVDGVLFDKNKKTLIQYPVGNSRTSYIILDSVTTIGNYAFYSCDSLKSVTIPDSVTTIGDSAFRYCNSLTDVYYSETKEQWKKISIGSNNYYLTNATIHYECCIHTNTEKYSKQNPTCTQVGYTAGSYCLDCKTWISGREKIAKIPHVYTKYTSNKNATLLADGTKTALCDYGCGNKKTVTDKGTKLTLGKPSDLKATQTTNSITLTWSKGKNATGYRLYYKLPGDMSWRQCVSYTTATSYTFKNIPAGTAYTFAVKSVGKVGSSTVYGSYITIATATKAVVPVKIEATQTTSTIKLTWNVCSGATGYRIYYKSGGSWKIMLNSTKANFHTFKKLKSGVKYIFAIRPYIKTESGNVWSAYTQFTTATKPANPTAKVTAPSKGKLTVTWSAVNGAESYQLWYKTGNGSYKLYKTYSSAKTLNFSNLKSGTKYTFAVRAVIKTDGGNIRSGYKAVSATVK